MIGGLKKVGLCLLASASVFTILASTASVAKAEYITREEFEKEVPEIKWKGAPKISSRDGKFSFKVRGRLMVDYDNINQDTAITGDPDQSGWEARRARLGVEGKVWYDWKYKFEMDFAGDAAEVKDAYISYAGFDWNDLQILFGQFKIANSLEGMTSSRFITFMERAAFIEAFEAEPRALGVGIHAGSDDAFGWSFQTSYNGSSIGDDGSFDEDPSIWAIRGTIAPINTDDTIVHLGASYRHRNNGTTDGVSDLYRYRAHGANLHLADRFVNTDHLGESDDYWGLEGAFVWRRFSVQGEYAELTPDVPQYYKSMSTRSLNPNYSGYYVQGSVFLTDDMRHYEADKGEFGRVKVHRPVFDGSGGFGAVELAGRYDTVDLGADAGALLAAGHDCSECGSQDTWLIGLNWYLTDYVAMKFNVTGSDIGGVFNVNDGANIDGFGMRGQIDW